MNTRLLAEVRSIIENAEIDGIVIDDGNIKRPKPKGKPGPRFYGLG